MSRLPIELFLALRYLRPKRTFVSVITLISILGVILGVAVLIIVLSVMTGFDRQLRDKLLGFSGDLQVFKAEDSLADYETVASAIASNHLVKAVAPFILAQVMIKTQPAVGKSMFWAPWLRGIDIERERSMTSIATSIVSGELSLEGEDLLVGSELARNLRLSVGDRVAVYSPRHLEEMERHKGKEGEVVIPADDYTVRGIFDVGYYEYNANVLVTSLRNAQDLYKLPGSVHGILVKLQDPYQVEQARAELYRTLGPDYRIKIWTEENATILTALAVEKNVMFYLLIFIVIVAAFGIMNSQITFVVQKTREIGMLRAMGATGAQVKWLFLSQSLIIGVIGVAGGLGLGLLALTYRNEFLHFMNRMTGVELFPAQIYAFSELPALIDPRDTAIICSSALVICLLAGFVPAWTASRLKPVEALRHE
jgi:lipoprotein-releasing system permease protein